MWAPSGWPLVNEKQVLSWQQWNMLPIKMCNKSQEKKYKKIYVDKIPFFYKPTTDKFIFASSMETDS